MSSGPQGPLSCSRPLIGPHAAHTHSLPKPYCAFLAPENPHTHSLRWPLSAHKVMASLLTITFTP